MTALRRYAVGAFALLLSTAFGCGGPEAEKEPTPAAPRIDSVAAARADAGPPIATAGDGVTVAGRVVSEESGRPIGGAYVVVLKPGVPFERWEASAGEETETLIQAAVRADSSGAYRVPSLPRGHEYTVMIGARGYRSAAFDLGLAVESDAAAVKTLEPVTLEPAVW